MLIFFVYILIIAQSMIFIWLLTLYYIYQGPAQAQNPRDSLAEVKSDIVVKVIVDFIAFMVYYLVLMFTYLGCNLLVTC